MDGLQRGERLKRRGGENARLKMDERGERAHHTAEAVVKRIWDANHRPMVGVTGAKPHEKGIVQNVVVSQRGPLRFAGCSACVLDVAGV